MMIANKKRGGASLDDVESRGYYWSVKALFVRCIVFLFVVTGCQSSKSVRILTPEKFMAVTGNAAYSTAGSGATEATNVKPRLISPGMVISITVDEDRSLNRQYSVPNSGAIDYPPLGQVSVEGLTTDELAGKIKAGLEKDYFHSATVRASIESAAGGGVIYVLGNINRPGPLLLPKDERFTVTKAIIAAGNFSTFANGGKVQLIRYDETGKKYKTYINVERIMKRGEFEKDVPVQSGDWIIVPEKLINF